MTTRTDPVRVEDLRSQAFEYDFKFLPYDDNRRLRGSLRTYIRVIFPCIAVYDNLPCL
jgi:hypothetical protein